MIIAVSNPKGGSGKSTATLVLATHLSHMGASVCVIDADPNRPILDWKTKGSTQCTVTVIADVNESNFFDVLDQQTPRFQFIFVDLEGTASFLVSRAISAASLVIVPIQASDKNRTGRAKGRPAIRQATFHQISHIDNSHTSPGSASIRIAEGT